MKAVEHNTETQEERLANIESCWIPVKIFATQVKWPKNKKSMSITVILLCIIDFLLQLNNPCFSSTTSLFCCRTLEITRKNMTEKQTLSAQNIIACLNSSYGIAAAKLIFLPIGVDMNASVYRAETPEGPSYFVKLRHGHHYDMSVTLLALLQASRIQQIIPPIKTIDGRLTQHINDFTLTVYPFIDGKNGFCNNLTDNQWITLGKCVSKLSKRACRMRGGRSCASIDQLPTHMLCIKTGEFT